MRCEEGKGIVSSTGALEERQLLGKMLGRWENGNGGGVDGR